MIFGKGVQNMCWKKASSTNGVLKAEFSPVED
jgi:hypothetical protein